MPGAYGFGEGGGVWGRKVSRACAQCGKVRWYRPSEVRKYCSRQCVAQAQVGRRTARWETKACAICGATFTRRASALDSSDVHYCSVACSNEGKRRATPKAVRFWSKVDRRGTEECWPWTAGLGTDGYGKFWVDGTSEHASRVAWELTNGPAPEATPMVLHRCDTPPCCNPAHLFLGTGKDNAQDMYAKGRGPTGERHSSKTHPERVARGERHGSRTKPDALPRGEAHHGAKLTATTVRAAREAHATGEPVAQIARRLGVTANTLWAVVKRETWRHVD